jgi:Uma2 family endonuclease
MNVAMQTRMTIEEYVALDRDSHERWEYANGEAWAAAGARPEHGLVVRNVVVALSSALRGRPCRPLIDGQKIATPLTGAFHYPDASVVCGPPTFDALDDRAMINPTVIVEVLSQTTADYDRGGKFAHYRTLPTLREYLVVDPAARTVEHHRRLESGSWMLSDLTGGPIALDSIGVALAWDDLWTDLDWLATATTSPSA